MALDQDSSIACWDCFQMPNGSRGLGASLRSGGWLISLLRLSALPRDTVAPLCWEASVAIDTPTRRASATIPTVRAALRDRHAGRALVARFTIQLAWRR